MHKIADFMNAVIIILCDFVASLYNCCELLIIINCCEYEGFVWYVSSPCCFCHTHICVYIYMYVCMYVCIYTYTLFVELRSSNGCFFRKSSSIHLSHFFAELVVSFQDVVFLLSHLSKTVIEVEALRPLHALELQGRAHFLPVEW